MHTLLGQLHQYQPYRALLAVGILSVILTAAVPALYSQLDNAFEWVLALLINLHALFAFLLGV